MIQSPEAVILANDHHRRSTIEVYDLVVLDAPPVVPVTDARIISRFTDAVLYCVRWNYTPRGAVAEGLREFSMVEPNIAGIVLTRVDEKKASGYGYRGYGYGYYRKSYSGHYYDT